MKVQKISWDNFKLKISEHLKSNLGPRLCRGQSNSNWGLVTSFHRNPNGLDLPSYFQYVIHLADVIGTLENRDIDINDNEVMGSFIAYLQHHGFPTPLLDWSLSPYIAAYFAFSDVNLKSLGSEDVSIFIFDYLKWNTFWNPVYDYTDTNPHVSVLQPKCLGNKRQIVQQGYIYTWTNIGDIGSHIDLHGKTKNDEYLEVYNISASERDYVMTDLEVMGINAYSLFGNTEALCKYYKESIFRADQITKDPFKRMAELAETYKK